MSMKFSLKPLSKCTSGNVAMITALAATTMISAGGSAVELVHWTSAQSNLYAAMDAAVLAGANELMTSRNESKALATAQSYFDASLDPASFASVNISFAINAGKNGVMAHGDAQMKTTLLQILGVNTLPLISNSSLGVDEAIGSPPGGAEKVEISLMLDVTGSMCDDGVGPCTSGSKLSAMKSAANALIDRIIPAGSDDKTKRIALVPFSTRVRVGGDGSGGNMMQALTNLDKTWSGYYNLCVDGSGGGGSEIDIPWTCNKFVPQPVNNWKIMPCVTDRYYDAGGNFDLSDDAPGPGKWLLAHGGDRAPTSGDSSDSVLSSATGTSLADPASHWNYDPNGTCSDVAGGDQITELTYDRGTLQASVNGLSAFGSTAGVLGTAFSWYTLSPNWSAIWSSKGRPDPYTELSEIGPSGAKKLRKIAILMTDGGYNTSRGWKDQPIAPLSSAAKSMCANMKSLGIEVYAIGFDLNSLTSNEASYARDTLSNCASDSSHFVDASTSAELNAAFENIGANMIATDIRLVK